MQLVSSNSKLQLEILKLKKKIEEARAAKVRAETGIATHLAEIKTLNEVFSISFHVSS